MNIHNKEITIRQAASKRKARHMARGTKMSFIPILQKPSYSMSLLMIIGSLACSGPGLSPEKDEALLSNKTPNVIFIIADDLGYGDLGCYGQKSVRTPNIDSLAAEGVRFTDFYAGSTVCAPSRSVLMTGQHTGHTYIRGNGKSNLRPEDLTVAEIMKSSGYSTGIFGKWGLGHEWGTGIPSRQGFDEFYGYLDQAHAHNYYPSFLIRNEERVQLRNVVPEEGQYGQGVATEKLEYSHTLIVEEALDFVKRNRDNPFFLYLPLTIPHANNEGNDKGMEVPSYEPYQEEDWPEAQKGTAAMITLMDSDLGRLMGLLETSGMAENTVVFFTSDNGPHREGGNDPDFFDSNGPLRGIKRDLYEGGIRVPMIVRWPGHTQPGTVSNHIGYFADVMATVAEIVGTRVPENLDSLSFLPSILSQEASQAQHKYLYWEFYERGSAQAIRMGQWKGVRKPMFDGPIELYDLESDLGEENDVAEDHPEIVKAVENYMREAHTPSELWQITPKN
jgi:uncharacterized sulfatase